LTAQSWVAEAVIPALETSYAGVVMGDTGALFRPAPPLWSK